MRVGPHTSASWSGTTYELICRNSAVFMLPPSQPAASAKVDVTHYTRSARATNRVRARVLLPPKLGARARRGHPGLRRHALPNIHDHALTRKSQGMTEQRQPLSTRRAGSIK